MELLHQRAENVREGFIQRARLFKVDQARFGFGHAVRQLVRHHVDSDGETVEDFAVSVAKYHLLTVPEGVLVLLAIVNGAAQRQPLVIQRIALIRLPEEIIGNAEIVPGFFGGDIVVFRLTLFTHQRAGQAFGVLRIVNFTIDMAAGGVFRRGRLLPVMRHQMLNMV